MIDTRDQLVSPQQHSSRRKSQHGTSRPQSQRNVNRSQATKSGSGKSLEIKRIFSDAKIKPFDQIEWEKRTAEITDDAGKVIFKQENVEVPKSWSMLATKVVVSKYFYGEQNTPERETSVRQLIHRICRTIADWGIKDGYFSKADGEIFYDELTWLCVNQYGAFNSPVWFNVGLYHQYGVGKNSGRATGFTTARPARPSAPRPNTNIRRAARASSSPSRTTWKTSCTSRTARRCCSSTAPAPAPI